MANPFFIIRRPEWISALVVFCPEGPLKRGMIGACISFFLSFFAFLSTGVGCLMLCAWEKLYHTVCICNVEEGPHPVD